jgi:hypothetical protein
MGLDLQDHGITKTIYVSKQAKASIKTQSIAKQNHGKWNEALLGESWYK